MDLGKAGSPWSLPANVSAPQQPELPGRCDVVVAGAGVFGATTALLLARRGLSVVLVDAGDPLQKSTTVHSTAKVTVGQGTLPARIAARHKDETAVQYLRATQMAMAFVATTSANAVTRADQFVYGEDADSIAEVLETARLLRASGVTLADAPPDLPWPATGYCVPDQMSLHPGEYLRDVISAAEQNGALYLPHHPMTSFSWRGPVRVVAGDSEVRAGHLVLATHYPPTLRGGWFATLSAERHFALLVSSPRATSAMTHLVGPTSRSTRPVGTDQMVIVGEGHPTGTSPRQPWLTLEQWVVDRFGPVRVIAHWAAQDTFNVADSLPIAGPVTPGSSVFAAAGFSGWGLTNGTIAAHQISARVLGEPDPSWGNWGPRLPGLQAAGRLVKHQAAVAGRLLGGIVSTDASPIADLAPGESAIVRDGLSQVAVHRDDSGDLHSVSARCTHLGCTVRWNPGERSWDCPCHGSRFDPTGRVLQGPAVEALALHPLDDAATTRKERTE
ncbi:MAG: FAD-dependent oxidoreductase [Micrococcales bacterium]|nr:FAD-dependent oxidoreductase [Micrococcales bacterium]